MFDPYPPYIDCPFCGSHDFGILSIYGEQYSRRCRKCRRPRGGEPGFLVRLPSLNKKVIYIDQCAVSEMMKALNPKSKANLAGRVDPIWRDLFIALDRLVKLQVIAVPYSEFHEEESSCFVPMFEALRTMYKHLGHGVGFKSRDAILDQQIYTALKAWLSNIAPCFNSGRKEAFGPEINHWHDHIYIVVNRPSDTDLVDELRRYRDQTAESMAEIFSEWQADESKKFEDWFRSEKLSYGEALIATHLQNLSKWAAACQNQSEPDLNLLLNRSSRIVSWIKGVLLRNGIPEGDCLGKTFEFLRSEQLGEVPIIKISAAMYAAIAKKGQSNRQMKAPNRGMAADVKVASLILPYCDAVYVDDFCRSLLLENPVRQLLNFSTKIFSKSTISDFLDYLAGLERKTSVDHFKTVEEVVPSSHIHHCCRSETPGARSNGYK